MFIRSIQRSLISKNLLSVQQRFISSSVVVRGSVPSTPSSSGDVKLSETAPGYRQEGRVPSNYEVATGKEREELLKNLAGEEAWNDLKPIVLTQKGTPKNPIKVYGTDPERYIGCTGFPADTHELVWLTVRPHQGNHVDRCPHCGNCFKYIRLDDDEHH